MGVKYSMLRKNDQLMTINNNSNNNLTTNIEQVIFKDQYDLQRNLRTSIIFNEK